MPTVTMPDGTAVQMPDKLDPELGARLRAFQQAQAEVPKGKAGKAKATPAGGKYRIGQPRQGPALPTLPFIDRTVLSAMDNDDEKEAFLQKKYGEASVVRRGKDFTVTINGKKFSAGTDFLSNMAADAPEIALGTYGAVEGGAAGTAVGGPVGGVAGAVIGGAAGAAGGKAVKEEVKRFTDTQRKTGAERTNALASAAAGGAMGELGGQVTGKIASRLTRGPLSKWITGATPETRGMTDRLLKGGAIPPPQSTMPDARKFQRITILADKLTGPSAKVDRKNAGYLQDRAEAIMDRAGLSKLAKADALGRLGKADSALSTQETGELLQRNARAAIAADRKAAEKAASVAAAQPQTASQVARAKIEEQLKMLKIGAGRAGNTTDRLFAELDKKAGGAKPRIKPVDGKYPPIAAKQPAEQMGQVKGAARQKGQSKVGYNLWYMSSEKHTPEDVYRWLVDSNQTHRLDWFVTKFGRESDVVAAVQQQALRQVLAGAMERSATGEGSGSIAKALARFTPKQQSILFPNGLADDLKLLQKEINFIYPGAKDPAMAGLSAGAILQRNFIRRWKSQIEYGIGRAILQNPAVIRRLAVGLRGDTAQRKAARAALRTMAMFSSLELAKPGEDPEARPQ